MTNKEILKKKIIYRSTHRGSKEMDILLGNFVKNHIDSLNDKELYNLLEILLIEDEVLHRWYFVDDNNKDVCISRLTMSILSYSAD